MPKLTITTEEGESITHDLTADLVTIGRAGDNTIIIEHPSISGHHAEFRARNGRYYLKDLGSTNGSVLEGSQLEDEEIPVDPGTSITFGYIDTVFEGDETTGEEAPPEVALSESTPADRSERPMDFVNTSPFPKRSKSKDTIQTVAIILGVVGILACAVSILLSLIMKG